MTIKYTNIIHSKALQNIGMKLYPLATLSEAVKVVIVGVHSTYFQQSHSLIDFCAFCRQILDICGSHLLVGSVVLRVRNMRWLSAVVSRLSARCSLTKVQNTLVTYI
jgi:hypothetical protein